MPKQVSLLCIVIFRLCVIQCFVFFYTEKSAPIEFISDECMEFFLFGKNLRQALIVHFTL